MICFKNNTSVAVWGRWEEGEVEISIRQTNEYPMHRPRDEGDVGPRVLVRSLSCHQTVGP